ncbi:MAG: hypothetical protein ACLFV6_02350 [Spirulinaceae cyanobacterium]
MKIILTATDEPLADAWEKYCGDIENVTVYRSIGVLPKEGLRKK